MASIRGHNRAPDRTGQGHRAPVPAYGAEACVLVVDDHADTRFLLRTILEMRGGVRVIEADNGEMAVALVGSVRVDLILMDTDLPLLDGYGATRRIRELPFAREVPIVFISGHAQPAAEARAFAAGCTDYLVKPFALDELDGVLQRHLAQSKAN
ncbi:MAG TPA: response regulator [Pyrinomonadaceae bacterium]|nr:response regulator [Pyrinomonadaceae bacterium]